MNLLETGNKIVSNEITTFNRTIHNYQNYYSLIKMGDINLMMQ